MIKFNPKQSTNLKLLIIGLFLIVYVGSVLFFPATAWFWLILLTTTSFILFVFFVFRSFKEKKAVVDNHGDVAKGPSSYVYNLFYLFILIAIIILVMSLFIKSPILDQAVNIIDKIVK